MEIDNQNTEAKQDGGNDVEDLVFELLVSYSQKKEEDQNVSSLAKICKNVVESPDEEKYRTLRCGNKRVTKIVEHEELATILSIAGFQEKTVVNAT